MYWRRDGEACAGNVNNMRPDLDLVAEWTESPVRTVTRKEIVPGRYGRIEVKADEADNARQLFDDNE